MTRRIRDWQFQMYKKYKMLYFIPKTIANQTEELQLHKSESS